VIPFYTETRIRWSDLDANRHLANASYMNFTSFARMEFLKHLGISMKHLAKSNLGPAVLREEFSFFKEGYDSEDVIITVEVTGMSAQGEMFEFTHNLYKKADGTHMAHAKILGVWFGMEQRKITPPTPTMLEAFREATAGKSVRTLSLADLKSLPVKPQNIDPDTWK
jgi:acyl-CoA thioester hydrolase